MAEKESKKKVKKGVKLTQPGKGDKIKKPSVLKGKSFITMKIKDYRKQEMEVVQEEINNTMNVEIEFKNFRENLGNGVLLCDLIKKIDNTFNIKIHRTAPVGSFFARENLANFVKACGRLSVKQVQLFEPNDLICATNYFRVYNCILSLARIASDKYGIAPPEIVQMEIEIDKLRKKDQEDPNYGQIKEQMAKIALENSLLVEKASSDIPIWQVYPVVKGDIVDEAVAKHIKQNHIELPIKRVGQGEYLFGSNPNKQYLRLVRNLLLVRYENSWERFVSFVDAETERQKKKAMVTSGTLENGQTGIVDVSDNEEEIIEHSQSLQIGWLSLVAEGDQAYDQGNFQTCIAKYQDSLDYIQQMEDQNGCIDIMFSMGKAYQALGLYRKSNDYYIQSSVLSKKLNIDNPGVDAPIELNKEYMVDPKKAISHLTDLMAYHKESNNSYAQGCVWQALGNAYQALGEFDNALEKFNTSLEIFTQQKCLLEISQVHHGIANVYKEMGDVDKALKHYELSRICEQT